MILSLGCKPWHHWCITKVISRQCISKKGEMPYMRNPFFAISHKHWITEACVSNSVRPSLGTDSHLNHWFLSFAIRFCISCCFNIQRFACWRGWRHWSCFIVMSVFCGVSGKLMNVRDECPYSVVYLVWHGVTRGREFKSQRAVKWYIGKTVET